MSHENSTSCTVVQTFGTPVRLQPAFAPHDMNDGMMGITKRVMATTMTMDVIKLSFV